MTDSTLSQIYLFSQMGDADLERVQSIAEVCKFHAGDRIFDQGDGADAFYVIKFGSVQVRHHGRVDDSAMVVRTMGSGAHFGEMPLIDGGARSAAVTVMEPSEITVIRYARLLALLDEHPAMAATFYRSVARYLSGRLRKTTDDLGFARDRSAR